MRDYGVWNGNESGWVWDFDGLPEAHDKLMAALEVATAWLDGPDDDG